ncbi:transmembrane protein, putative [Medicago truncatula]|uniref:Transmembrane protein, putative n=1 Tax=Medicago truncatula TaxID=3880 RepID=G7KBZ7_MEDTR|nr:transmembrane protein, putative [Medicago truncatula]
MTMTLTSSTLQIRRHEYSGDLNIVILVIFVGICILPFYAINMDVVSLFTYSSFLFLRNLDLYCIDVLYQFE